MHASVHWRTPSLTVNDGRGLPIRQIGYLRSVAGEPAIALITRQGYDVTGRNVTQQDPRLIVPNLVTAYGLGGQLLEVEELTRITWDSMNQLEKTGRLRPLESAVDVSTQTVAFEQRVRFRVPMKARKSARH